MNELLSLFTQNILKDNDTKSARYAIGVLAECMRELEVSKAKISSDVFQDIIKNEVANESSGIQTKPPYTYTHGQKFKAEICGTECEGKVSIGASGNIYLCQDKMSENNAPDLFGFKFSWYISNENKNGLELTKVTNLILYPL